MAIILNETEVPAVAEKKLMDGKGIYDFGAGDRFRIQKRIDGNTTSVLDETVPAGKQWEVRIEVSIEETDA